VTITRRGLNQVSDRNLRGQFYERLEIATQQSWVNDLSFAVSSDSEGESFADLDRPPTLQPKQSGSSPARPSMRTWQIENEEFEASVGLPEKILRRDKTGLINRHLDDLAVRTTTHWRKLMTTLVETGHQVTISRDNATFFSASHAEGDFTGQKNLLTANEIPSLNVATPTAPTAVELADAVSALIAHFYTFKDAEGEPFNEDAMRFLVMLPQNFANVAVKAFEKELLNGGSGTQQNPLVNGRYSIGYAINPRLTWTDSLSVFRVDTGNKPFMRQSETLPDGDADDIRLTILGMDSEYRKQNDEVLVKVYASRNVGFTHSWHTALKATLS
jgi:hypothetical protein